MTISKIEHSFFTEGYLKYEHLLGKEFQQGRQDCYTILEKIFADNTDIRLTPYARPDKFWLNKDMDLYRNNFSKEGFVPVDINTSGDWRTLDVGLVAIPDPDDMSHTMINHAFVYLTDGWVIHHRLGKLSELQQYRGWVKNMTVMVIRHKDVPEIKPEGRAKLDLMDHILPHKRHLLMGASDGGNGNNRD